MVRSEIEKSAKGLAILTILAIYNQPAHYHPAYLANLAGGNDEN